MISPDDTDEIGSQIDRFLCPTVVSGEVSTRYWFAVSVHWRRLASVEGSQDAPRVDASGARKSGSSLQNRSIRGQVVAMLFIAFDATSKGLLLRS